MTNAKSTKRALLTSMMAMLLCFTMLLGTTYAWFTDSATSGSNVITAGNLDIEVQYTLGDKDENGVYVWKNLDNATDLFQKGSWEPGHTEVVALKIENKGSLTLKYNASMNIVDETVGKTKDGKDIVLSDILTVSTLNVQAVDTDGNANQIGDITLGLAFNGENSVAYETTTTFKAGNVLRADKELQPGAAHYLIVKVDMAETVGNEANHDGVNVPSIEFGINVLATQYTKEEDSFGPNYDENAKYDYNLWDGVSKTAPVVDENGVYHITNAAELVGMMDVTGNSIYIGKTIVLENNINLAGKTVKGIGSDVTNFAGTFDGQGYTISNFKIDATDRDYYAGLFNQVANVGTVKNLTVKNATVVGNSMVGAVASSVDGNSVIDNCKAIDCTVSGVKKVGAVVGYSAGSTVTNNYAENCTVLYSEKESGEILGFENTGSTVNNYTAKNVTVVLGTIVFNTDEAQAALNNAKEGATIVLAAGKYGTIVAKSNITIQGVPGAVVDCVNLNGAANVNLLNIEFDAAGAQAAYRYNNDSAVTYANIVSGSKTSQVGARNILIDGCTFTGKFANGGAAIAFTDRSRPTGGSGNVTIRNCTFNTENAYYDVYGYYTGSPNMTFSIENNTFESDCEGLPIYLGRLATSEDIVVKGNTFTTTDSLENSVYTQAHSDTYTPDLDAADNKFEG